MSSLNNEIQEALCAFPGLKVEIINNNIKLTGKIEINNTFKDEHIVDAYTVEINIPKEYPKELPTIKETGRRIKREFRHIYNNHELCLATFADMKLKLGENFKLLDWIDNFVVPYFFSNSYFEKYKILPFGERSHGSIGILEFYTEYFKVDNKKSAYNILKYSCEKKYRGHDECPCGSGEKIRNCHKDIVLKSKEGTRLEILSNDLKDIMKEREEFI